MLPGKSKGKRKERAKEMKQEASGTTKEKIRELTLGVGPRCNAKERKDHNLLFQLLAFILFTPL